MKTRLFPLFVLGTMLFFSCSESVENEHTPIKESTKLLAGRAVIKTIPSGDNWIAITEEFQPAQDFTKPKREILWMNNEFVEKSNYKPDEGWSLIDAVVHPSGDVTAINIQLEFLAPPDYRWNTRIVRIKSDGSKVEFRLNEIATTAPENPLYPGTLDRAKLVAYGEDVFVVARGRYHVVQAHRLSFEGDQFTVDWQTVVEPSSFVTISGILGGGFDNFHQTERFFYVYADVDDEGSLYVGVPSSEDLLINHDESFHDNLMSFTDPGTFNFGMAVLTKLSAGGARMYSKLVSENRSTRLLNMSVGNNRVYFVGRHKKAQEISAWDAWIHTSDSNTGEKIYSNMIDIRGGDMFWDAREMNDGRVIAAGTTDYTQNPGGLSVSDARRAVAIVLNPNGNMIQEIELPQGPAARGSEAMGVSLLDNGGVVVSGAHNAPGTHAEVYSDGFIAVKKVLN